MEFETVKDGLKDLIELCESKKMTSGNEPISFEDLQSLYQERIYALADLLGMEDIYLNK